MINSSDDAYFNFYGICVMSRDVWFSVKFKKLQTPLMWCILDIITAAESTLKGCGKCVQVQGEYLKMTA